MHESSPSLLSLTITLRFIIISKEGEITSDFLTGYVKYFQFPFSKVYLRQGPAQFGRVPPHVP